MSNEFVLFFWAKPRALNYSVAQKISNTIFPLTPQYAWPVDDGWEKTTSFLAKQNWISKEEANDKILKELSRVINYWEAQNPRIVRYADHLQEHFPISEYPHFRFLGRSHKRSSKKRRKKKSIDR